MKRRDDITAIETAYKYLASRMRTRSEVERHLRDKGYSSGEIHDAISELADMKYIDDYQYALRYYEYNREKKRGSARAARELADKGVDMEIIRNAREDYLYAEKVNEYEDALAVGEKELILRADRGQVSEEEPGSRQATGWNDKISAGIARKLDSRGFDRGDIFKVLDELRARCESEE